MWYFAIILFSIIMGMNPAWALDPQVAKDLEQKMPDLFMLLHGGSEFVIEKGFVIAKVYETNLTTFKPEFKWERVLGSPEEVKEFLRGYIVKGMAEFRSRPYHRDNRKEALFDGAISTLGSDALKDPAVEPMLLEILHDPQFAESYRSSAMDTLAEIDFDKHFPTFLKFIDPPPLPGSNNGSLEHDAWDITVTQASGSQLDRLEPIIAKYSNEHWREYITERIAKRRAELKKGP